MPVEIDPLEIEVENFSRKFEIDNRKTVPALKAQYRYIHPKLERLTADETRDRRFRSALKVAREQTVSRPSIPVSSRNKAQAAIPSASVATATDRRFFHPLGDWRPMKTIFGSSAAHFLKHGLRGQFSHPSIAIPCVQRAVKREVMFALKKAGKGHRTRKRRNFQSLMDC